MTTKEKRAALTCILDVLAESLEYGTMPQPSTFGLVGKDDDTGSNMYDLCNELLCSIKIED